jgi:hypothetical protein
MTNCCWGVTASTLAGFSAQHNPAGLEVLVQGSTPVSFTKNYYISEQEVAATIIPNDVEHVEIINPFLVNALRYL